MPGAKVRAFGVQQKNSEGRVISHVSENRRQLDGGVALEHPSSETYAVDAAVSMVINQSSPQGTPPPPAQSDEPRRFGSCSNISLLQHTRWPSSLAVVTITCRPHSLHS
jgi:hypothetical protein